VQSRNEPGYGDRVDAQTRGGLHSKAKVRGATILGVFLLATWSVLVIPPLLGSTIRICTNSGCSELPANEFVLYTVLTTLFLIGSAVASFAFAVREVRRKS